MSAPPAMLEIRLPTAAAAAALVASSAAFAAGAPGVPAAANVAASATLIVVSETCFAACSAAAAAAGTPRQAGKFPINTLRLPGPGASIGGAGCATLSVSLAAGFPGITSSKHHQLRRIMAPLTVTIAFALRSIFWAASTLTPICDFISMPLACMVNLPVVDLIVMSELASIVMVFLALSIVTLLFPVLSMISM